MDPNAALAELRQIVADNRDKEYMSDFDAERLIELFDALDSWLSSGCFAPDEWVVEK